MELFFFRTLYYMHDYQNRHIEQTLEKKITFLKYYNIGTTADKQRFDQREKSRAQSYL